MGPTSSDVHVDGYLRPPRRRRRTDRIEKASPPRPLYVRRDLVNAEELVRWAKAQGFATTLPADDMHVTVAYSKSPVDWFAAGEAWDEKIAVRRGGPRTIECLGANGDAVVLRFASDSLRWRHEQFKDAGASWDWPDYCPHVTITWQAPDGLDVSAIEPFQGELRFGPEVFEEIDDDWRAGVAEKSDGHLYADVVKVDRVHGLVLGWAIACTKGGEPYYDLHGDHIPDDVMLAAAVEFAQSGAMAAKEMHVGARAGSILFVFPMTADVAKAYGIETPQTGLMVAMRPDSIGVLEKFDRQEYTGFSIGGRIGFLADVD